MRDRKQGARPGERGRSSSWARGGWMWGLFALVAAALIAGGCDECCDDDWDDCGPCAPDQVAPLTPTDLWSVTGDREVFLRWNPNTEEDLAGYRIYRSTQSQGYFPRIATVGYAQSSFVDRDVRNGETYYYTIAAYDHDGNESGLFTPSIHDTPRPSGGGLRLQNARLDARDSGYDFSSGRVIDYHELEADIYFWHSDDEGAWMVATERSADAYTDIQDAGYRSLDLVDWAPEQGWSPRGEVPLIEGHAYIVWTWDDHYAKFRVASLTPDRVVLDWAYQSDPGNPELLRPGMAPPVKRLGGGVRTHEHGSKAR